jgi:hypothetical protein
LCYPYSIAEARLNLSQVWVSIAAFLFDTVSSLEYVIRHIHAQNGLRDGEDELPIPNP